MVRIGRGLAAVMIVALMTMVPWRGATSAFAASTWTVTDCSSEYGSTGTSATPDTGSIAWAVNQANGNTSGLIATGDTINFGCSGTILFTQGLLITGTMTIDGSGQNVVFDGSGAPTSRPEGLLGFNSAEVLINDLTLTHGSYGAVNSSNTELVVRNSTFTDNHYPDDTHYGEWGGAILELGGLVTVANSTFTGNSAGLGGALYNWCEIITQMEFGVCGDMYVTQSTFTGNSADGGGAIDATYGFTIAAVTITDSTIAGNSAKDFGGGIDLAAVSLAGNIIAGNSPQNCNIAAPDGVSQEHDGGYNLSDDSSCGLSAANHDLVNTDAKLGPLADNGGPTETMALLPSSPAIDQIPTAGAQGNLMCPSVSHHNSVGYPQNPDQRGIARPDNGETSCDIGAFEYQGPEQSAQTINFTSTAPDGAVYGDTYTPAASATSGLSVTFSASGACSYDNTSNQVTMIGVGTCTVNADQAGDSSYSAAPQVKQTFSVGKKPLTVSASHDAIVYGDPVPTSFTIGYSGWVGSDDSTNAISGTPTCSTTYTTTSDTGSYPISCTLGTLSSTNYAPVNGSGTALPADGGPGLVLGTLSVNQANQATLTVAGPASGTYGQSYTLTSSGGSGTGAVTYDAGSSTACSVSGDQLSITSGTGTCAVTASKAADTNYASTTSVAATVLVNKAASTVTIASSVTPSIVGQSVTFTATVSSAGTRTGTVTFTDGSTPLGTGAVNGDGVATYTTSASALTAGTHAITASYGSDPNVTGSASSPVSQQVGYGVKTLSGSSLTIVLQLQNFTLANLSSSKIPVTAKCVVSSSATAPTSCTSSVQTINKAFGFVNNYRGTGPAYSFSVNPRGLTKGQSYYLLVQTGSDPILHAIQFTV